MKPNQLNYKYLINIIIIANKLKINTHIKTHTHKRTYTKMYTNAHIRNAFNGEKLTFFSCVSSDKFNWL